MKKKKKQTPEQMGLGSLRKPQLCIHVNARLKKKKNPSLELFFSLLKALINTLGYAF